MRWIVGCDGEIHCLTHSMGGLVTRVLLATRRPANLGRVVMLGPPNSGSEIADLLARYALHRRVFDPAGVEPITRGSPALTSLLGEVDYPVGVIAGRRAINPVSWMLLPKPNDGEVAVMHTRVSGMADHLVLPVDLTFMVRDPAVLAGCVALPAVRSLRWLNTNGAGRARARYAGRACQACPLPLYQRPSTKLAPRSPALIV